MPPGNLVKYRETNGAGSAIVFVHGGGGSPRSWGRFPDFIVGDKRLEHYDAYGFSYPSHLLRLAPKWWKDDPRVEDLPTMLETCMELHLRDYRSVAFIAHSLGGLIVQRALLDFEALRVKVKHFVQFGVSSAGFNRLGLGRRMKHCSAITPDSPFIRALRDAWDAMFAPVPKDFTFVSVAGSTDMWVPTESSLDPFDPRCRAMIHGDHFDIIRPSSPDASCVRLVIQVLTGEWRAITWEPVPTRGAVRTQGAVRTRGSSAKPAPVWPMASNAAGEQVAKHIDALLGGTAPRDVLAAMGRSPGDAFSKVRQLAAALNQLWWVAGDANAARAAARFFQAGRAAAEAGGRFAEAALYEINGALVCLAHSGDREGARQMAHRVVGYCERADGSGWTRAIEGDAWLIAGDPQRAMAAYRLAAAASENEGGAVLEQGLRIALFLDDEPTAEGLTALFSASEGRE